MRLCRTLFIYYGGAAEWGGQRLRELLSESFSEWGAIEDIHVVPSKCIGFVRYAFRASAEFAKEAMMGQKLRAGGKGRTLVRSLLLGDSPGSTLDRPDGVIRRIDVKSFVFKVAEHAPRC